MSAPNSSQLTQGVTPQYVRRHNRACVRPGVGGRGAVLHRSATRRPEPARLLVVNVRIDLGISEYPFRSQSMPTAAPASTAAVAQELVSLCRAGKNLDAIAKLYSKDIVSVEPIGSQQMPAEMRGIDAIRGKNEWWFENNQIHSAQAIGPFVGEDQFVVRYDFDVTAKPSGQRMQMSEMALYTVKDGQIVREQFFYHMPGA